MKKFQLFLITALLTAFAGQAWGQKYPSLKEAQSDTFGIAIAYGTVGGKVAISTSSTAPEDSQFSGHTEIAIKTAGPTNKTYYFYAKPDYGYEFMAWAEDYAGKYGVNNTSRTNLVTSDDSPTKAFEVPIITTANKVTKTFEKISENQKYQSDAEKHYYAIFRKKIFTEESYYISNLANGLLLNGNTTGAEHSGSSQFFFDTKLQDWTIRNAKKHVKFDQDISDIYQIYFEQNGNKNNIYFGQVQGSVGKSEDAFKFDNRYIGETTEKDKSSNTVTYKTYRKYNCYLYKIKAEDLTNGKDNITATKVVKDPSEELADDGYYFIAANGEFNNLVVLATTKWKRSFDSKNEYYKTDYPHAVVGVPIQALDATATIPTTITIPKTITTKIANMNQDEMTFDIKELIYRITSTKQKIVQVHIGQYGIATYCSEYNLRIPEGCTVSGAKESIFKNVWRTSPVPADKVLKAEVPFLIEGEPNSIVTFSIVENEDYAKLGDNEKVEEIEGNILSGTTLYTTIRNEKDIYVLYNNTTKGVERAEFRLNNIENMLGPNKGYIDAKLYFTDAQPSGKLLLDLSATEDNTETGINKHHQSAKSGKMFTPWGTVAGKDYHGVVIMDGKKLFINK